MSPARVTFAPSCEAPRCKKPRAGQWRDPANGVTWNGCAAHLAKWIAEIVLRGGFRSTLSCDISNETGLPVVWVVSEGIDTRSSSGDK